MTTHKTKKPHPTPNNNNTAANNNTNLSTQPRKKLPQPQQCVTNTPNQPANPTSHDLLAATAELKNLIKETIAALSSEAKA